MCYNSLQYNPSIVQCRLTVFVDVLSSIILSVCLSLKNDCHVILKKRGPYDRREVSVGGSNITHSQTMSMHLHRTCSLKTNALKSISPLSGKLNVMDPYRVMNYSLLQHYCNTRSHPQEKFVCQPLLTPLVSSSENIDSYHLFTSPYRCYCAGSS